MGGNSVEPVVNARLLGVDGASRDCVQSQEWFAHVPIRVVVQVRAVLAQAFEGFSLCVAGALVCACQVNEEVNAWRDTPAW